MEFFIALFGLIFIGISAFNKKILASNTNRLTQKRSVIEYDWGSEEIKRLEYDFLQDPYGAAESISSSLEAVFDKNWRSILNRHFFDRTLLNRDCTYGFQNIWNAVYHIYFAKEGYYLTWKYGIYCVFHGIDEIPERDGISKSGEYNFKTCREIETLIQTKRGAEYTLWWYDCGYFSKKILGWKQWIDQLGNVQKSRPW